MYRIVGPRLFVYIVVVGIGAAIAAFITEYFATTRNLSILALSIGETGLSFVPVLALYPKASLKQAVFLAMIYFFTTLLICFLAWGINSLGFTSNHAFLLKDGQFHLNTCSLFIANATSLFALITSFKVIHDEDSAKSSNHNKTKFNPSQKVDFFKAEEQTKRTKDESESQKLESTPLKAGEPKNLDSPILNEDFWKPFDFEPETRAESNINLPEESSGALLSPKEKKEEIHQSSYNPIEKTMPPEPLTFNPTLEKAKEEISDKGLQKKTNTTPVPTPIYYDLEAIFEQYSSLNLVKKLTTSRQTKREKTRTTVTTTSENEIHEAVYRQVTEENKLEELREELKKEIKQEFDLKFKEPEESQTELMKTLKEELLQDIKAEIKKELLENPQEMEKILNSNESTSENIHKTFSDNSPEEAKEKPLEIGLKQTPEFSPEEINNLHNKLDQIMKNNDKAISGIYLNKDGTVITQINSENMIEDSFIGQNSINAFNLINQECNKTSQGGLLHMLIESDEGIITLVNEENKILTLHTRGSGEIYTGQLLRELSS